MAPALTDQVVSKWLADYPLLRDERRVFENWRDLVNVYQVKGKNAHDTRLVAAMRRHGISDLLTFNGVDFATVFSGNASFLLKHRGTEDTEGKPLW